MFPTHLSALEVDFAGLVMWMFREVVSALPRLPCNQSCLGVTESQRETGVLFALILWPLV